MKNILFYKFVEIDEPMSFRDKHQVFCDSLELKGKVLVAHEGVNGCISGSEDACEAYKTMMWSDTRFEDIEFKESSVKDHTFRKMIVRIRDEIITFKQPQSKLRNTAPYIEPQELKQLYESGEEFYLLDARNNYESAIGKFKNAITPDIDVFSDFPQFLKDVEHLKDKKIVTYCTGGIRCEKASALMREQGFSSVFQLHGGIIQYGDVCSSDYWEGKCFVFDERVAIEVDPAKKAEPITSCAHCDRKDDRYYNCANVDCDKRFISCKDCVEKSSGKCETC
jgi:UPF0176 protein